jgi:hypothetical protein
MAGVCGEADPSPPSAPLPSESDWVFIGILLCEGAVSMIALGANIQRYGLVRVAPDRRLGIIRREMPRRIAQPHRVPPCNDCICCLQPLGLSAAPRAFFLLRLSTAVWLCGLLAYSSGNVLFLLALGFAPASLCSALLATVVVVNAVIARVLLKEQLQRCDWHGGLLISIGIAITAANAPYETVEFDAVQVAALFSDPYGAVYTALLILIALCLGGLVL